ERGVEGIQVGAVDRRGDVPERVEWHRLAIDLGVVEAGRYQEREDRRELRGIRDLLVGAPRLRRDVAEGDGICTRAHPDRIDGRACRHVSAELAGARMRRIHATKAGIGFAVGKKKDDVLPWRKEREGVVDRGQGLRKAGPASEIRLWNERELL